MNTDNEKPNSVNDNNLERGLVIMNTIEECIAKLENAKVVFPSAIWASKDGLSVTNVLSEELATTKSEILGKYVAMVCPYNMNALIAAYRNNQKIDVEELHTMIVLLGYEAWSVEKNIVRAGSGIIDTALPHFANYIAIANPNNVGMIVDYFRSLYH